MKQKVPKNGPEYVWQNRKMAKKGPKMPKMCKKPRKTAFFREKSRFFEKKIFVCIYLYEIFGQKWGHFFFCAGVERISKKSAKNTGPPRGFWPKIAKKCQKWPFLTLFSGHFTFAPPRRKRTFPKFSGFCAKIEQKRVFFRGFPGISGLFEPLEGKILWGFGGPRVRDPKKGDFPYSPVPQDPRQGWPKSGENSQKTRESGFFQAAVCG